MKFIKDNHERAHMVFYKKMIYNGVLEEHREYVGKNLRISGPRLEEFLSINFGEKWYQFDVLQKGEIEIEQMSSLLKQVMGDMTINIQ